MLSSLISRAKALIADENAADIVERLRFGEALLAFSWMFASSAAGVTALNNSGIMHLIIPAIRDCGARKGRFLSLAVKTLTPQPSTLYPLPSTLYPNPKPSTLNPAS